MLRSVPAILKNKYFLALLAVMVWLMFFDKNNFVQQWRLQKQIRELQRDRTYYLEEIQQDSIALKQLREDPDALERYARETYLMKKPDEDIFIVAD